MKPFAIQIGACLLGLLAFGGTATGASIPSGGYTNNFPTQPGAADWSTVAIAGVAGDAITPVQVGTNIAALTAAAITNQLAASNASPPVATTRAVWSTNGYVQTRPTASRITVLMASFVNGTGSNVGALNISYDLALVAGLAEQLPGHRVYYSLSGTANSWVAVNALSGADTNLSVNSMSASLLLGNWPTNASLYLLWADDNGSAAPDTALQIDNFVIKATQDAPLVTVQPQSLAVAFGATVAFSVGVTSTVPVTYQWHVNCRNIHNATNATLTISNVEPNDVGTYSVTVSNSFGQTTSWDASLQVTNIIGGIDPGLSAVVSFTNLNLTWPITQEQFQLQEASNLDGVAPAWSDSSASVSVVGARYFASVPIAAAKKFYRLFGNSFSSHILNHPLGRSADLGEVVTLSVTATGAPPIFYQWRFNGFNLDGATNASLTQTLTNNSQFGAYQVDVYVADKTSVSRPAVIRPAETQSVLSDSFAGRPLFTNQSDSIHGVTFGASNQAGETNFAGFAVGKSVWLRWRAPGHGFVKFDTVGSAFDTVLSVSLGTNFAALTRVAGDDDAYSNLWSATIFNVSSNVEYNISVSGQEESEGFFVLNWEFTPLLPSQSIPIIDVQPQDSLVPSNTVATFTVAAHGLAPLTNLTYQWYYNGTPIPGSQTGTNATLSVGSTNGAPFILGPYTVDVMNTNPALTVHSLKAFLQLASNTNLHFVTKASGDSICSSFLVNATNCCGGSLAASGHKPAASGLPPVISYAEGTLYDGDKIKGGAGAIVTWVYVKNVTWELTGVEVTLSLTATLGKVQLELTTPGATATSSSFMFSQTPVSTTATLKFTPLLGTAYTIGIGREKRDAIFTLTASQ